jgi:hypothetical protein
VLDILHGQMFCLNRVGSRILELLEQGWDEAHIAEEIGRTFGVSIETTRTDVDEFIEALKEHHLLESCASRELHG